MPVSACLWGFVRTVPVFGLLLLVLTVIHLVRTVAVIESHRHRRRHRLRFLHRVSLHRQLKMAVPDEMGLCFCSPSISSQPIW